MVWKTSWNPSSRLRYVSSTECLHTGHDAFCLSQRSTHSLCNMCKQGIVLSVSPTSKSDRQMAHVREESPPPSCPPSPTLTSPSLLVPDSALSPSHVVSVEAPSRRLKVCKGRRAISVSLAPPCPPSESILIGIPPVMRSSMARTSSRVKVPFEFNPPLNSVRLKRLRTFWLPP